MGQSDNVVQDHPGVRLQQKFGIMFWNDASFCLLCNNVTKIKLMQSFKVKLNAFRSFLYECGQGSTFCAIMGENLDLILL